MALCAGTNRLGGPLARTGHLLLNNLKSNPIGRRRIRPDAQTAKNRLWGCGLDAPLIDHRQHRVERVDLDRDVLDIRLDADAQSSLPCSAVAKLEQFDLDL